jgi:ubiquinone/menaquinone biosynthesis C-methylase UbiE
MIRRTTENSQKENKTWLSESIESNINQQDFSKIRHAICRSVLFSTRFLRSVSLFSLRKNKKMEATKLRCMCNLILA